MIRNTLAVIAGSALWTVLWLSYNALLGSLGQLPFDGVNRFVAPGPLVLLLLGSVAFSLLAGAVTARLSRDRDAGSRLSGLGAVWALALLQFALGIFFQAQVWSLLPLWYHLFFLGTLVPATWFGGRLVSR